MSRTKKQPPVALSDRIAARASELHDAAFRDPSINPKPAWANSLARAEKELSESTETAPLTAPIL